jgi:hypothetical protein
MAVTTSAMTLNYNVGQFNQVTGISIPDSSLSDNISFLKNIIVSDELGQFDPVGGDNATIYLLCRVLFNNVEVYKHPQYDTDWTDVFIGDPAPTGANATIAVTDFSTTPVEVLTQGTLIPIQKNSAGEVTNGNYTIYIKYVYPFSAGDSWNEESVTYNIQFAFTELEPQLTYWYDTSIPILSVTDGQSYINGSNQAERATEFELTFPLNYGSETDELENIQTITYDTFYTQANELVYTILLTYEYTTWNVINVQQQYQTLNVIYVDRCVIYDCLKTLYDQWVAQSCSTAANNRIYNKLQQANILANLIINGLGCNSEDLSGLIVQFNAIANCDCGCNDTTLPRLLQATS